MTRRPLDVPVHEWQHHLITERVSLSNSCPRHSALEKLHAREIDKRALWTLKDHLQQFHNMRSSVTATIADLMALHDKASR